MRKDESTVIKTGLITYKDPEATLSKEICEILCSAMFSCSKESYQDKELGKALKLIDEWQVKEARLSKNE